MITSRIYYSAKWRRASVLILEVKGYDPVEEVKSAAAQRWINGVNSDGRYGTWSYSVVKRQSEIATHFARTV